MSDSERIFGCFASDPKLVNDVVFLKVHENETFRKLYDKKVNCQLWKRQREKDHGPWGAKAPYHCHARFLEKFGIQYEHLDDGTAVEEIAEDMMTDLVIEKKRKDGKGFYFDFSGQNCDDCEG